MQGKGIGKREMLKMLISLVVLGALAVVFYRASKLPVVVRSAATDRPTACYCEASGWERAPITSATCQAVLKGKFSLDWEP
jgi:hypothetical protein